MALIMENPGWEKIRGQIRSLVRGSRGLLTRYGWTWVSFVGKPRQILIDKAHRSMFSIHHGATKMCNNLGENY